MSRGHKERAQTLDMLRYKLGSKITRLAKKQNTENLVNCYKCKNAHDTLYKLDKDVYICKSCKAKYDRKYAKGE
jgi:ribosomal protein L37AE/L43A